MKAIKLFTASLLLLMIQACSAPPSGIKEDITVSTTPAEEVSEETTSNTTDELAERIKEEGVKITEDLLNEGLGKIDSVLNELLNPDNIETTDTGDNGGTIDIDGTTERFPVEVESVADGDTITIRFLGDSKTPNSGTYKVRYLLLDTPESVHPTKGVQPFSIEASDRNKELLKSGKITIEFDIGGKIDKYNRLLGYIFVDGKSVNEILIREGLARVGYVYPPNTRYLDDYQKAEQEAKDKGIGIWSIENYADNGFE